MRQINVIEDSDLIVVSVEDEQGVIEYKFSKDKFMELIKNNANGINTYSE